MTSEQLKSIKEREEKATPGPWTLEEGIIEKRITAPYPQGMIPHETLPYVVFVPGCAMYSEDMDFIVHAREDIPGLIADVERLRMKLADCREMALASQSLGAGAALSVPGHIIELTEKV